MSMFNESRDRQYQKSGERLDKEVDENKPVLSQTGGYDGAAVDSPTGRRHSVKTPDGGVIQGEFITPSAVGTGQNVAIYYSDDGSALFDAL